MGGIGQGRGVNGMEGEGACNGMGRVVAGRAG
jgi:hypothetical protein